MNRRLSYWTVEALAWLLVALAVGAFVALTAGCRTPATPPVVEWSGPSLPSAPAEPPEAPIQPIVDPSASQEPTEPVPQSGRCGDTEWPPPSYWVDGPDPERPEGPPANPLDLSGLVGYGLAVAILALAIVAELRRR